MDQKETIRSAFHRDLLANVAAGKGQPRYDTKPMLFSTRQHAWFAGNRFSSYAKRIGRSPTAAVLKMERGYATYKSIVTGSPYKTEPVDAYLTGALVASLRTRVRVNQSAGTLTVWTAFRRQARRDGQMTNRQLVQFFADRGAINNFKPDEEQIENMIRDTGWTRA